MITKTLPPPPAPPRQVIIKRMPPLPAKPRPVIIEKWLPYKTPPDRPVIYERVPSSQPPPQPQRNVILQYEQARVRIEQDVQNAGCYRVDPAIYRAQFGTSLRRTESIRRVLQGIGLNPDMIASDGYQMREPNERRRYFSSTSHNDDLLERTTCFTDEQLSTLLGSSPNTVRNYGVPPTSTKPNQVYYTTVTSNG